MSSRVVCPGLYRVGSRFYCKFAEGAEVDPAFMPCIADYWNCEFYRRWEEKRRAAPAAATAAKGPEQAVPAAVEARVEVAPPPKPPAPQRLSMVEEVDDLVRQAVDLGKIWEEYEREARAVVERWEELRERMRKELAGLEKAIDAYAAEIERLEAKLKSGALSQQEYEELKSSLDRELAERLSLKEQLEKKLVELDRAVLPHFKRVKAAEAKPELAKLRLALAKLEQKFRSGEVTQEVYERLKGEIEERIRRLERIREEVEEL